MSDLLIYFRNMQCFQLCPPGGCMLGQLRLGGDALSAPAGEMG